MIVGVFVLAVAALVCSIIAIVTAAKKKEKVVETQQVVKVEYAPVEHPFIYDEEKGAYTLNGDLEVTGGISALKAVKKRTKKTKAEEEKA